MWLGDGCTLFYGLSDILGAHMGLVRADEDLSCFNDLDYVLKMMQNLIDSDFCSEDQNLTEAETKVLLDLDCLLKYQDDYQNAFEYIQSQHPGWTNEAVPAN